MVQFCYLEWCLGCIVIHGSNSDGNVHLPCRQSSDVPLHFEDSGCFVILFCHCPWRILMWWACEAIETFRDVHILEHYKIFYGPYTFSQFCSPCFYKVTAQIEPYGKLVEGNQLLYTRYFPWENRGAKNLFMGNSSCCLSYACLSLCCNVEGILTTVSCYLALRYLSYGNLIYIYTMNNFVSQNLDTTLYTESFWYAVQ